MSGVPFESSSRPLEGGLRLIAGTLAVSALLVLLVPPALATSEDNAGIGVATEDATATRDAASILTSGGSAADAAIVAALVAGVASPTSSGIGGGGFAMLYSRKDGAVALDFREVAPRAVLREPFEERPLERERVGHLVGVPGEVRGLWELHKKAGVKPWHVLVQKAVRRAENGFFVGPHLGSMLAAYRDSLITVPGLAKLFFPHGKPALVGTRLTRPALAKTLTKIAAQGPAGFYEGDVARDIVDTARTYESPMTLEDLQGYTAVWRAPLTVEYEGNQVHTMPPPSAGGLMMVQTLRLFPADYLRHLGHGSPAYQHALAEAMRAAIADRMRYLGDPDHQTIALSSLLSDERMEKRRDRIVLDRTHAVARFGLEEHGTHALITADRKGNVVSLTTTVNRLFGAKVLAEASGVILNDELDDFTSAKDVALFGMQETPNRPRPGARPVSSMTPTIVERDGQAVLALGGSGGMTIATNATQTLLAQLVFGHSPRKAVSADRIYVPIQGPTVVVANDTSDAHIADLRRRGELVAKMPARATAIQMLSFDDGKVQGAADPRKHGLAITGR
jgi:gamma-glutamyltranspeptidase/glutathione hydrolase